MTKKVTVPLEVASFHAELIKTAAECQRLCFITRAKELQIEVIEELSGLIEKGVKIKEKFIIVEDEDSANAMLSMENILNALRWELQMWVALKDDDANNAWDFLVNAESSMRSSLTVHPIGETLNCEGYLHHLNMVEITVFPLQLFFSVGIIVDEAVCSICDREYGECDHIKGRAYMGKECICIIKHVRMLETSIVDKPANKHARATGITDNDGIFRNVMTWQPIPLPTKEENNRKSDNYPSP